MRGGRGQEHLVGPRSAPAAAVGVLVLAASAHAACSLLVQPTWVRDGAAASDAPRTEAGAPADFAAGDGPPSDHLAPPDDRALPDTGPPPDLGPCPVGSACDDGDPCTINDRCDTAQTCVGQRAPDGTSCGSAPAQRCCGGQCHDLSADKNHCGGCNIACRPGFACADVARTGCAVAPQRTSGRCGCSGGDNALCPNAQDCRAASPGANLCSPKLASSCAPGQSLQWVTDCPNFCVY